MSNSNVNDLLDATLDDLEDLPEFEVYPAGAHRVSVSTSMKEVGGKSAVEMRFKYLECLELSNSDDIPPKEKDECSVLFMLDNEFGRGAMKKALTPIGAALGTRTIREVIEQCKDVECAIVTSIRKDKNDPDKKYLNLKELAVV